MIQERKNEKKIEAKEHFSTRLEITIKLHVSVETGIRNKILIVIQRNVCPLLLSSFAQRNFITIEYGAGECERKQYETVFFFRFSVKKKSTFAAAAKSTNKRERKKKKNCI